MELSEKLEEAGRFLSGESQLGRQFDKKLEDASKTVFYNLLFIIFLQFSMIVLAVILSPLFTSSSHPPLKGLGMLTMIVAGLGHFCHQLPHRSFIISGIPMAVCARDVGIYVGVLAGAATSFLENPPKILSKKRMILLAFIPIALDGVSQTILGLRESNNLMRLITGFFFTFGIFSFIFQRWVSPYLHGFRVRVFRKNALIADLAVTLLLVYVFMGAFSHFGATFMSRQDALGMAVQDFDGQGAGVKATYLPPNAVFSYRFDPYINSHMTPVVEDVLGMGWVDDHVNQSIKPLNRSFNPQNLVEGVDLISTLGKRVFRHRLGIWVVQVTGPNESVYYYIDAFSHEVIAETRH